MKDSLNYGFKGERSDESLQQYSKSYLKIEKDLSAFKYEAKDNRRIQQISIARVFKKAGPYIFNLGLVNFFEFIIVNLLLVIRCYWSEVSELEEI